MQIRNKKSAYYSWNIKFRDSNNQWVVSQTIILKIQKLYYLGTLASSHRPKICILGQLVILNWLHQPCDRLVLCPGCTLMFTL